MKAEQDLPMRIVGSRQKTVWDRYADIVRIGRSFWKGRRKGIEIMSADGTWKSCERNARGKPSRRRSMILFSSPGS